MTKLTQEQINELIAEKEAELARDEQREAIMKSMKRLIKKADKEGFRLRKVLGAHIIAKEEDRWTLE